MNEKEINWAWTYSKQHDKIENTLYQQYIIVTEKLNSAMITVKW